VVRLAVVPCVLVLVVAASGCTAERPEQQAARQAVQAHLATATGYDDEIHCTRNPRPWFIERPVNVFICAAERDDGDCDWYRVTARDGKVVVALEREHAGCVLPL
jgi:hypothetical protein